MIFKKVGEGRPYPDHGRQTPKDWADVPPRARDYLGRIDAQVATNFLEERSF